MERYVRIFFRYSLAIIFVWFGALKIVDASPAYELVTRTFFFLPPRFAAHFIGYWELLVGGCFLFRRSLKWALILMALQIPGTFLSLFVVPELCFVRVPFVLTTNGEFIIKNLLIIGAGLLLGASLHPSGQPVSSSAILK
jgi:uncharacterized membrane protein YkgB